MTADDGTHDVQLARRAKERLGPHGDALAREVLDAGVLVIVPAVLDWDGSHGHVRGDRVVVRADPELLARLVERPAARDAILAAVAAAIADEPGRALADLAFAEAGTRPRREGPYR